MRWACLINYKFMLNVLFFGPHGMSVIKKRSLLTKYSFYFKIQRDSNFMKPAARQYNATK